MPRFSWAAWGLLVVVLDLPLLGWDVLPDLVGYVWLVHRPGRGRSPAPGASRGPGRLRWSGIPVVRHHRHSLHRQPTGVEWGAAFAGILVNVVVLHQLGTAIRDLDPVEGDSDQRRWANGIRIAAPHRGRRAARRPGAHRAPCCAILYVVGLLALVVVGIIAVVLLHRVNRAGWLDTPEPGGPASRDRDRRSRVENTPPPANRETACSLLSTRPEPAWRQRRKGTSRSSRPRSLSSARSGISSSIQPVCLMPQNDAWSGP